jgi:hypothetical protein
LPDLRDSVLAGSPTDFEELTADDTKKCGKVVKFSVAKPE